MRTLVALAQADGRAVSREELLARGWDGVIVSDHAINRVIVRLRQLSGANEAAFRIETVPKVGYRLIASTDGAASLDAAATTPVLAPEGVPARSLVAGLLGPRTLLIAALITALATGATLLPSRPAHTERWAVLRFATPSDGALEPFAHSVAAKIRGALAGADLAAAAYVEESLFRGPRLREAAARERIEFVLDGIIRDEVETLVVDAHVIDAPSNQIVWSKSYRRAVAEAALLEEQVAAHVAAVLRCALLSRRPNGARMNPETLGAFLRACDQVQQFDSGRADLLAAGRMLTAHAPRFSRGWSMLALAAAYGSRGAPAPERQGLQQLARNAASRALALDADNGEAYLARSVILPLLGAWSEREALIAEALKREPVSVEANLLHSELLAEQGRIAAALAANDRALAIEPLSPVALAARIPLVATIGEQQEIEALRERLFRTWPTAPSAIFNRFNSLLYTGEHVSALEMLNSGAMASMPLLRTFLEASIAGDAAAVEASMRAVIDAANAGKIDRASAIALAAYSGRLDDAFALASIHYDDIDTAASEPLAGAGRWVIFVRSTHAMRRDPRFAPLVARLGLTAHWRRTGIWADDCSVAPRACGKP